MFGPSSSPYKVSHSGTESAVVLQCLMLLAAFLTPFSRDFSDFFSPLGREGAQGKTQSQKGAPSALLS